MEFISAKEAISKINNNSHLMISGFGNIGICNDLLKALHDSYLFNKKPNNLTILSAVSLGNLTYDDVGFNLLALDGLVSSIITSHMGMCKKMAEYVISNNINTYMLPLGVYLQLLDSMIRKENGVLTKIGINTCCDPRISKENKNIDVINVNDCEYLFYKNTYVDVCFIKAKLADKLGNICIKEDEIINDCLEVAMACKRFNGIVIVEVEEVVDKLDSKDIYISNIFVDYIVVSSSFEKVDDTYGEIKLNRLKCAKRAYLEIKDNDIINIGVGMPDVINDFIIEDNRQNLVTVSLESGLIGGKLRLKQYFGSSKDYKSRIKMSDMLKLYSSNFLDIAFLGAAQVDKYGNVNVSKFKNRLVGPGGFIDIVSNAKKIVFLTNLVTKNNEVKFVNNIEQITFASKNALLNNQEVIYITDICVFKLTNNGLKLIEVDSDIDIEKDILKYIEFKIDIDASLLKRKEEKR